MASPEGVLPLGASTEESTQEDPAPPATGGEDDRMSVSALGLKDRLERAHRFLYQRHECRFITARGMRKVIADVETRPDYLEKVNVQRYIVA